MSLTALVVIGISLYAAIGLFKCGIVAYKSIDEQKEMLKKINKLTNKN